MTDYELITEIAVKNAESKKLEEELKKLKAEAQARFPIGTTMVQNAMITIKEVARGFFDSKKFKVDYPKLYTTYETVSTYKTVSCEVGE